MKTTYPPGKLLMIFAIALIAAGCSKDHALKPAISKFQVSVKPSFAAAATNTWQQVLGGEATLNFNPVANDSVSISATTDSLNLSTLSAYTATLFQGTYNISLGTNSTAVADTFIRFTAQANNQLIDQNQAVTLQATTNDAVITINKSLTDTTTVPTFVASGTTVVQNFGQANGYYFIYVSGGSTGRVTFVELTSGYTYMADITVTSLNQYDLTPILNPKAVRIRTKRFANLTPLKK